ncbi:phage gp6-like head-tail connector protein [Mesorhizobium sp. CGMCC 1.15528]|uniref:Phage gp6-like head-tail connector protein n=1 Tax=Mesorhizobium zhangyense TaxID=1776730 RepID=A0A7C9RBH0_9HYPH|nr:head-tail connector protein [Mesorhizobium zhangyense]NGN44980.1 phage gp6-like head-tail connector protein [Mesorhizobium zhangyense]
MAVDLAIAKKHLNIFHDDDDELITAYLGAATAWTLKHCNRETVPAEATFQFEAAALLMVGELYEHREISVDSFSENPAAKRLIDPFRLMRV